LEDEFSNYKGRQNFHNFSKGIGSDQPEAFRKILSTKVDLVKFGSCLSEQPIEVPISNLETSEPLETKLLYFKLQLTGNSFMYHQIRKMIGLVLMRQLAPQQYSDPISSYLGTNKRMIITAPSEGLLLDKVCFGSDDPITREKMRLKEGPSAEDPELTAAEEEQRLKFKHQVIYPQIHNQEREGKVFGDWLFWADSNSSKLEEFEQSFRQKWGPAL
jgi:tRNA pseudouridine38-40 synthase